MLIYVLPLQKKTSQEFQCKTPKIFNSKFPNCQSPEKPPCVPFTPSSFVLSLALSVANPFGAEQLCQTDGENFLRFIGFLVQVFDFKR